MKALKEKQTPKAQEKNKGNQVWEAPEMSVIHIDNTEAGPVGLPDGDSQS